ncbi:alpha-(1,3)-fucosyltransferase C isoform X1 [Procambarus clarkii]|uniref:alpha-(1,3)-fucosyltransferase C isoform X1 n=2 Tax=Procambarus clarkii TaxID=6728 RepID=UPI0037445A1D
MLRSVRKTKRVFLTMVLGSVLMLASYQLYTSSQRGRKSNLADGIRSLVSTADHLGKKISVIKESLDVKTHAWFGNIQFSSNLPEDSNLPYIDEKSLNITTRPVDLYNEAMASKGDLDPDNPPLKKILFWNSAYDNMHYGFGFGREPFLRAGCPVNTCMTTSNRSRFPLKDIDALMWHFRANDRSLPATRSPHTRYVFWVMESASYLFGELGSYKNIFNWTFTYRRDSDFPNLYGQVFRRTKPLQPQERNYAANKTKMAAWFVSNCNTMSGREKVVEKLRQWITVDQYGACGELKCDRQQEAEVCFPMLNSHYKFYLAFENSLCQDYVTEKFFNKLRLDVVPVVYGLGNYSASAPPHSYIDALKFPTVKSLALYLIYLNNNDTAYNEYFRWKRFHQQPHDWVLVAKPFCDLCERLHSDNTTKVYNMHHWFVDGSSCKIFNSKDIEAFIAG